MSKRVLAVRGAVDVLPGPGEEHSMVESVGRLLDALRDRNNIEVGDIISIQFTQTENLRKKNAAAALREHSDAYGSVPLFCAQEPAVDGAPESIVRVLLTWYGHAPVQTAYLGKAAALRPDLN